MGTLERLSHTKRRGKGREEKRREGVEGREEKRREEVVERRERGSSEKRTCCVRRRKKFSR